MRTPQVPDISIVIPVHNEEHHLPLCLQAISHARAHFPGSLEVIVVLNRCTDQSEAVAKSWSCNIVREESKNLSAIRNRGILAAQSEIVVTIDADSRMHPRTLQRVSALLAHPRIVGGGVLILPERWSLGIIVTMLALLPIALYYRIGAGLFFFKRSAFNAIGGFDETRFSAEDIDFMVRLDRHARAQGCRTRVLLNSPITTSCRKFDRFGDWYFVRHPLLMLRLLRNRDRDAANEVWYHFNDS